MEKILIIHGYSDCSTSFVALKKFLVNKNHGNVETIFYADYESREDSLTFNDVADGLNDSLIRKKIISKDGRSKDKIKVIVHSTGGLVIRHWIWKYYYSCGTIKECPVTNIVMLAPANFGSPLAHRGKSFLGSLVKGRWKVGDFLEVGKKILDGLELASPFQWEIAHRDLLIDETYFSSDLIKTTILVGDKAYDGIIGWVNKPGTDGTVVLSGTNLDTVKLTLEFVKPGSDYETYTPHKWTGDKSICEIAFGILHGYNHGSIVEEADKDGEVSDFILRGLIDDAQKFKQLKEDLVKVSAESYLKSGNPKFQQFLVHAVDDFGLSVNDFSLEFSVFKQNKTDGVIITNNKLNQLEYEYSRNINEIITDEIHQNSNDKSFRRLLVNHTELYKFVERLNADPKLKDGYVISMKVYVPEVSRGITYDIRNLENIVIFDSTSLTKDVPQFFFENTTTLIELQVDRVNEYVVIGTNPRKH